MAAFLTFVAQEMLKKVASLASKEFSLVWGFKGELTKLCESLDNLEAMLRDVDHLRQNQGEAVKRWLEKLEDITHDADDVLDDYTYEFLRCKVELQNQMKKKVQHFFSLSNPIAFRAKMAHKIKKINTSLESLNKKALTIGLVAKPSLEATTSHDIRIDRETYSGFKKDENKIIGRKEVVSDIVKALTNSNNNKENDLSVLAIMGMGGLGKTTLAKSVYHDDKIKQHFQEKMWVCVSTPFEVHSILRGILESIIPENAAVQAIDAICRILKKELKDKRYLLVLDDVWNEDAQKWDDLISCLLEVPDTYGSSIIVTTRSDKVAKIVENLPRRDLRKLSDDECWLILKDKAVPVGSAPIPEDHEKLGREIAKKCGGVPLVATVLGSMMHSKNRDGWQSIVESDIWELPEGEHRILSILKLSFDDLRSPSLKQCFAYCSNFIKDFVFEKDDLIQLWMAQGWLYSSSDKNNVEMEVRGNGYFHILLEKSFFQDVTTDGRGNITKCKMHDLVHDLAVSVSKSKNLRSHFWNGEALGSTLPRALRVLNLYNADIQELPISVGKLKHLRYLNVMKTELKALPKSVGQLYNLQTLKMPDHLNAFPREIANLINLRHVYFGKYMKVPIGILGRLTNLQSLPFFKMGEETGPGIEELGGLNQLKDTLSIYGLENVRDGEQAQKANLVEKKHILKLVLGWKLSRPSNNDDEDVLEGLRPHSNLEFLEIQGFMGVKFPSWLLLSNNLKEIKLFECNKCEGVPILGHLPNLVHVKMERMENLKCLGSEFYGYDHVSHGHAKAALFPALKTLHIEEARNLIEWMEAPTDRLRVFPCLEELSLIRCDKLTSAPSHFPSLQKLRIECMDSWMPIASIVSSQLTTLIYLVIEGIKGLTSLPEGMLKANKNLARLWIQGCSELITIAPQGLEVESLQWLGIGRCPKLRYLPDGLLNSLSALANLYISECESLESIPIPEHGGLPSLHTLEIDECPQLSSLPAGLQYCTSLHTLRMRNCPKITCIPITSKGLPSLHQLWVADCPELSSLPSGLSYCTSLQDLTIETCHKVTSISIDSLISLQSLTIGNVECLSTLHVGFTSLRKLRISGCKSTSPQFELQFCDSLQILVSLQDLTITDCPNLETIPSLDKLTSLRSLEISQCCGLKCLPSGVASSSHYLGRLKTLCIGAFWTELDSFPAIQVIPQLEELTLDGWPKLKSLPEQIQLFTSLTTLFVISFDGLEAVPEWLGNLTSLKFLRIYNCKNVMYLPSVEAMHRLTKLNSLLVMGCPLLSKRCAEENGPEWPKIYHIPDLQTLNDTPTGSLSRCPLKWSQGISLALWIRWQMRLWFQSR